MSTGYQVREKERSSPGTTLSFTQTTPIMQDHTYTQVGNCWVQVQEG